MSCNQSSTNVTIGHIPWNKDRLIGPKPPFKLREIWAIRIRLQLLRIVRHLPVRFRGTLAVLRMRAGVAQSLTDPLVVCWFCCTVSLLDGFILSVLQDSATNY